MARQVNSPNELFQSGPSESQIFEGLDELISSSVLYSLVASTPIVPEPQSEPQPQIPFQAVEQPVQPEAGPSQRRAPKNQRYSHVQMKALESFLAVHPTQTYEQKFLLSQQIGLTMKKINKWILRHKAPVIQSDEQLIAELISRNEELLKEFEELKMQNRILINALQAGNCPQCGGPVPPPDDSVDQELLWGDIRDFMPTSTECSLMLVPSEDLSGPAHDLVGVPAEEVSSIVRRAKDELIFMATAGYPLCISSDSNAFHQKLSTLESTCECLNEIFLPLTFNLKPRVCSLLSPTTGWKLDCCVDVSVDELRQFHRPSTRSICRKRPSGCLIRDMQNGSSLVTWVENVDVREKEDEVHAILKPFVESSFAFGASRWIAILQRQAERFIYSTGINISPSDAPISPEGRRSLT
ncbi:hypothetical protein M0R45_035482 [Rubus argutus]|uniref:START domain-containing protein n=1 Tax=Rubus argutus TaxID=59490 RepID=A0AAW1VX43_RUBAR